MIEVDVSDDDRKVIWTYSVAFNTPGQGSREPEIKAEKVVKYGDDGTAEVIVDRPNATDRADEFLLRETHIEQPTANAKFRELGRFFSEIAYVHLVPQLLKFGDEIGGRVVSDDPFGQEFMLRISRTSGSTRNARLNRIEKALRSIVPHLEDLSFVLDRVSGRPHLEIRFRHHRPHGAIQREDQFSDGTLRLISLLWLIQERGESPLLLEEPELSLNEEIVRQLPLALTHVKSQARSNKQVIITTHSSALLSNAGIGSESIVMIDPSSDGSKVRAPSDSEAEAMARGFSPAEAVLPSVQKTSLNRQPKLDV